MKLLNRITAAGRGVMQQFARYASTIYALSSGQGKCGVAVIRVSGSHSASALRTLTDRDQLPPERRLVLRRLFGPPAASPVDCGGGEEGDGGEGGRQLLDRALVVWMPAPRTFTGEDCCELHPHGGPAVVAAVMDALGAVPGLRPALPGEFTRRAFSNNKLDMTQVEGLADLIHAETEWQRRQALRQADGALARLYAQWRHLLVSALAAAEAYIDFAEDDQIDDGVLDRVGSDAERLRGEIEAHLQTASRGRRLRDGLRVSIGGAANAGKSSLLNGLVRREAAIVSPLAGTTRDAIETPIDIAGLPVLLADTAGLRDSADPVEREGVRRARHSLQCADLVLLVVDCRVALEWLRQRRRPAADCELTTAAAATADDCPSLAAFIEHHSRELHLPLTATIPDPASPAPANTLLVLNKRDLLCRRQCQLLQQWLGGSRRALLLSCTHDPFDACAAWLSRHMLPLCCAGGTAGHQAAPTRHRHERHLRAAADHLARFVHSDAPQRDLAVSVQQLRAALQQLGHVTGHVHTEQLLDVLFADFCIGK